MVGLNPNFDLWQFGGNALQDLGYGLANSSTVGNAFGTAARYGAAQQPYRDQQQTLEEQRKQDALEKNQTSEYLRAAYPEYAHLPPAEGIKFAFAAEAAKRNATLGGDNTPANIREWQAYNAMTPEQKGEYIRMKRANPYLDVGTGFVQPDPINPGLTSGPAIAKDNYTPAYDSALGGGQGKVDVENQSAFDSLNSKMPGLKTVIGELGQLAKTATYTATGQFIDNAMREAGMEPTEAAVARAKYISMVDNQILPLLRDTFGAQFTQKEGETLRATLGDANRSPAEKQAILEAFIEQKARDLEAMQSRLPQAGGAVDYRSKYGLE